MALCCTEIPLLITPEVSPLPTVIEVRTSGPFGMTYVYPADDPQATATR